MHLVDWYKLTLRTIPPQPRHKKKEINKMYFIQRRASIFQYFGFIAKCVSMGTLNINDLACVCITGVNRAWS